MSACALCGHPEHPQHVRCNDGGCNCTHGPWTRKEGLPAFELEDVVDMVTKDGKVVAVKRKAGKPVVRP